MTDFEPNPSGEELYKPKIALDSIDFSKLTDSDLSEVNEFAMRELNEAKKYKEVAESKEEADERIMGVIRHGNFGIKLLEDRETNRGYYISAKDENDRLVGFGVVNFKPNEEEPDNVSAYFGRGWDETGKGVAAKILVEEIRLMKASGVKKYKELVNPASKKVFERLEIPFQVLSQKSGGEELLIDLEGFNIEPDTNYSA